MTTESNPPSSEAGPDRKIEDIATDIEHTRHEFGAPTGASSANTDLTGRAKQKVAEVQDRIPETTSPTTDVRVEIGRTAQPTVMAALIATAAVVVVGVVKWLRHR